MKTLLIIAHSPSANTLSIKGALAKGAQTEPRIITKIQSPFDTAADDILQADGVVLFTTENFGYMSGALKDLFDRIYYQVIDHQRGLPYALIVRAGKDGTGARRATESIVTGLGWSKVQESLILPGEFSTEFLTRAQELTEGFAVGLAEGIF